MPEIVKNVVVSNENKYTRERVISWDLAILDPSDPVIGYNVYRSEVSYADFEKLNEFPLQSTTTTFTDKVPQTPVQPFMWWVKVTALTRSAESDLTLSLPVCDTNYNDFNAAPFIQTEPAAYSEQDATKIGDGGEFQTLPSTTVNPRWFLEIRKRHRWLLEMGGKRVWLFKRRWSGTLCPLYDPLRKQHSQITTAGSIDPCFGTGFIGGYHTPIEITVSFVNPAQKATKMQRFGMWFEFEPKSWSLWEPNLLDRDIIVRQDNNERFELTSIEATRWRGLPLRQNFDLRLLEPTSAAYKLVIPGA